MSVARWVRALEHTGARLDANLANFVLPDQGNLTCIDVLPPLLASLRPVEAGPVGAGDRRAVLRR